MIFSFSHSTTKIICRRNFRAETSTSSSSTYFRLSVHAYLPPSPPFIGSTCPASCSANDAAPTHYLRRGGKRSPITSRYMPRPNIITPEYYYEQSITSAVDVKSTEDLFPLKTPSDPGIESNSTGHNSRANRKKQGKYPIHRCAETLHFWKVKML